MQEIQTQQTKEEVKEHLRDRRWRLNHLYYIIDEHGQKILFKFNWFQEVLSKTFWYLNIILKARQVGVTTFICIMYLDDVLFADNLNAAIIADTAPHAEEIFRTKIEFAWQSLPDYIKEKYAVDTETKNALKFNNNSSIRCVTSARSGTYQRLHISEFGKICSKYPEKAVEIITGALNTVHAGEIVTIESTAEGAWGHFYEYCIKAMELEQTGSELTKMDYKFFFFPWYLVPNYRLRGNFFVPKEFEDYFNGLEKMLNIKLDQEQRNWYVKKTETQKEYMKREYPSTPMEAFEAAIEGSYFGKYLERARIEKRTSIRVLHETTIPVCTWWDLGMNDTNTITFVQHIGREIRLIDYYENSGEGLAHYINILDDKRQKLGYKYGIHIAPFDIMVRDLSTGKTRLETASSLGLNFQVAPKLEIRDGIDAVRNAFNRFYVDPVNCDKLLKSFAMYRKEWDDKLSVFKDKPLHDEHSHRIDSIRTGITGMMDVLGITIASSEGNYWQRNDILREQGIISMGGGMVVTTPEAMDDYDKYGLKPRF